MRSETNTPMVSVIIPNYNHARYLRRRIESVLGQTYQDFEVILLDDCSTDQSREILESYANHPKVRCEFNAQNSGTVFKQWNKGVRMARGRYIWIAESDDYADIGYLARMVPILGEQAEVAFAYCRSWRVTEDDQLNGFADAEFDRLDSNHWAADFVVDGVQELRRFFTVSDPVSNTSAAIFRKDVYNAIGQADEGFAMCSDYKVWAEMALKGKVAYIAKPLNFYRSHSENVRTRTETGALGVAEYFHVMLWIVDRVAPTNTIQQKALIDKVLSVRPIVLSPLERIEAAKQALTCIAEWNLRNNSHISIEAMRAYFMDWDFALVGNEFAICPPSRWRFFLHRSRFYRHYFSRMGWGPKLTNFMRLLGSPVVGYRRRHLPEQVYARVIRTLKGE
jgi:glycosyltransferase involved in cell wall biosynthesis